MKKKECSLLKQNLRRLVPLNDFIVITDSDTEEKTTAGIYLPAAQSDMPETHKATVVAISETWNTKNGNKLKVGDKVLYKHFRNIKHMEYEFIRGDDIFGIL